MCNDKEFFRSITGGGSLRPSSSARLTKGLTECQSGWDVTRTPGWNAAHLLHVIEALQVASKEELRLEINLDVYMVSYLNRGFLLQVDFDGLTSEYYSSVNNALPYYIKMGNYFREHTNQVSAYRPFFMGVLSISILKLFITRKSPLPEQVCATVMKKDMAEAKKTLTKWFELLLRIQERRQLAAWHLNGIIERQIKKNRKKLSNAENEYQNAYKALNGWYKTIKDVREINKFVDELKAIKDLNDKINGVIGIFKDPLKAIESKMKSEVNSKLAGSKGKWDIIKLGITKMGEYLATTELIAYHGKTIEGVLISYARATEDIFKQLSYITELEQDLSEVRLIEEINPALYGLDSWGML